MRVSRAEGLIRVARCGDPLGRAAGRVRGQLLLMTIFHRGTRLGETMSALSSPRSPISVCARPIWPGGESGEPWRLCLLESGASVTVRSRPPQAHSRSPPPLAPARLLAIVVSVQLVEGRTVDRRRSALHLHARDATGDADDAPSARTNDRLRHCHAWWCTATAALAAHKSFVLEAAEAANLQRHTGEAGIL